MKFSFVAAATAALSLSTLVSAADGDRVAHARQAEKMKRVPVPQASSSSSTSAATSSKPTSSGVSSSTTSSGAPAGQTTAAATVITIDPLSSITAGVATGPTLPLTTTYLPGATPPIDGAPPLPTCTSYFFLAGQLFCFSDELSRRQLSSIKLTGLISITSLRLVRTLHSFLPFSFIEKIRL